MGTSSVNRGRHIAATLVAAAGLLLGGFQTARAQQGAVTGEVVNAQNQQPVSGAQVFIPQTQYGTLTGDDGTFRITGVPPGQHTVKVTVIGFRPQTTRVTVQAGQAANVTFQLRVSAVSLEEIVVTQTGEQQRQELTTAMTTINADQQVQQRQPPNFSNLLQGVTPGASIKQSSGSIGTNSSITIRGPTSISLDNTPIIYVDGVRVNNDNTEFPFFTGGQQASRLNDMNPDNIESIQVLKGPAATTLYGSEAAAGVIRITTKGGQGDPNWEFQTQLGGNWDPTTWPGVTYNPTEDRFLSMEAIFGIPAPKDTVYVTNVLEGENVGLRSPFRTGLQQEYSFSTRGGFADGNVNYFASGTREERDGNLPANTVEGWDMRGNFGLTGEDFTLQVNNGFTAKDTQLPQNDNNSFGFIGNTLLGFGQFAGIKHADPNAGGDPITTCPFAVEMSRTLGFPLGPASDAVCGTPLFAGFETMDELALTSSSDQIQRYTGSLNLTYRPASWLSTRYTLGYDETSREDTQFIPVRPELSDRISTAFDGFVGKTHTTVQTLTAQATATSNVNVTDWLGSETTVGFQFFEDQSDLVGGTGSEFPAGSPAFDNSVTTDLFDGFSEKRTLGYFAQQRFSYRDKLFVDGGVRADNSSAFGRELGFEVFPRAGFSYVLSEEDWFPAFFEQFKVRGAWGTSGKQPGTNDALALLSTVSVPFRGSELLGVQPNRPGNLLLEPERDSEFTTGLDASLLDGRVSTSVTWYRKEAEDALVNKPLAPSVGFPGSQFTNIGRMVNQGFEVEVNAKAVSRPNLEWDWAAQFSTTENEIEKLNQPITDIGFIQRHTEGKEFGSFFAREAFFTEDGTIAVTDTAVFVGGSGVTKLSGSLSTTMTLFGHVTLYALADVNTGSELANNTESFRCWFLATCPQIFETKPNGELTDDAKLIGTQAKRRLDGNSIYDADYVKLRTASVRVRMPTDWVDYFGIEEMSLSVIGTNLGSFDNYPGVDPELNMFGGNFGEEEARSDFLTLPPSRSFTAELSVSF